MPDEREGALDPLVAAHFRGWPTSSSSPECLRFVRTDTYNEAEIFTVGARVVVSGSGLQKLIGVIDPAYFILSRRVGVLVLPAVGTCAIEAWADDGYGVCEGHVEQAMSHPPPRDDKYYVLELPRAVKLLGEDKRASCLVKIKRDRVAGIPGHSVAASSKLLDKYGIYQDMGLVITDRVLQVLQCMDGFEYMYAVSIDLK